MPFSRFAAQFGRRGLPSAHFLSDGADDSSSQTSNQSTDASQQGAQAGGQGAEAICLSEGAPPEVLPLCNSAGAYLGGKVGKFAVGFANDLGGLFGGGDSISCSGPGCAAAEPEQTVLLVPHDVAVALNDLILQQAQAAGIDPNAQVASNSQTQERTARTFAYIVAAGHAFSAAPPIAQATLFANSTQDEIDQANHGIDSLVDESNPQGGWFTATDTTYAAGSLRNALVSAALLNGGETAMGTNWPYILQQIAAATPPAVQVTPAPVTSTPAPVTNTPTPTASPTQANGPSTVAKTTTPPAPPPASHLVRNLFLVTAVGAASWAAYRTWKKQPIVPPAVKKQASTLMTKVKALAT